MNLPKLIAELKAQGLSDSQIVTILSAAQDQDQGQDQDQDTEDQDTEDQDTDTEDQDTDTDDQDTDTDGQDTDTDDQDTDTEDQDTDTEDQDTEDQDTEDQDTDTEDQDTDTEDQDTDTDDQDEDEDNDHDQEGSPDSWGGRSIPEGYTPPQVTMGDSHEATRALRQWAQNSLGGRTESPRRDAQKLCIRMASQASLVRTRKVEESRKRLLVCVDISDSCRDFARQYIEVAWALGKVEKRLAVLVHSNGIPVSLTVDGQERKGCFDGLVNWQTQNLKNSQSVMDTYFERNGRRQNAHDTTLERASFRNFDFPRFWGILQGLNLQGALVLGDSDAEAMIDFLAGNLPVTWITNRECDRAPYGTQKTRSVREKGLLGPLFAGHYNAAKSGIWKQINKLPRR